MSCKLRHRFARQNAKERLMQLGAINQFNEVLNRPLVIKEMNTFREHAANQYNITANMIMFEDTLQASKVLFNEAAFRAIDVLKGVNKNIFHDIETRNYINQAKEQVRFDPAFESLFDVDPLSNTSAPTSGVTNLVTLKTNLLSMAKQRLSKIKPLLRENKDNATEYTRLIKLQNELKDYINGNESRGIKGLEAEIEELSKVDSRAPEFIEPYVEKELQRLEGLIASKDPGSSKEAQQIIDFIKAMGNFNPLAVHPLYHISEIYDQDGNLLLTDAMIKPFTDWAHRATELERDLSFQNKRIIEDVFNNNSNIKEMFGNRKFTYEEILNTKEGLKDANWVDMMFMDITSGIFSSNGLMPQVIKQAVDRSLEREYAWSKEINEKIEALTPQVQAELRKLGYGLDNLGFIGIKGVSYDMFSQKFENGSNQSTGNIVHKYSNKWFEDRAEMNTKFWQDIATIRNAAVDSTTEKKMYKLAFDSRNAWFKKNTQLINPALISSIINNPEFASLASHFTASQTEIDAHEQLLQSIVGNDHLQKVISSQETKLKQYLVQKDIATDEILASEGVSSVDQLTERGQRSVEIWEAEHNPFTGVSYRETGAPTKIGSGEYHAKFEFNDYVPLGTINNKPSNFYDENYSKVENNPTLKEFYDTIYAATSAMKAKLPFDIQEKMLSTSVPNIEKSIIELILDKDLDFMQSISEVFRRIIDAIKSLIGVNQQDQFSYAKVNPITGLPEYRVNDSFMSQNVNKINDLFFIRKTKFMNDFNRLSTRKLGNMTRFKAIPIKYITPQIASLISQYAGKNYSVQELQNQYGENIPVGKIVYRSVQHEVAQEKSFDLPKVIKLYTHLTSQFVARQEVLPAIELMKSHYEEIKNQVTNNSNNPIINAISGENRKKGFRTNASAQFDNWFERVVLGNYGLQKHYGFFSTDKKIYDQAEEELKKEIDAVLETTTDEETKKQLGAIKEKLGKKIAFSAMIDSLFKFIRGIGLGFNLNSGLTNFIQGQEANSILAASGEDFKSEFIHEVSPSDMIFADLVKQSNQGNIPEKVAKAYYLAKTTDILQDNTNDLQKASAGSTGSTIIRKLNLFYITAKPEHYNQIPVMVATLKAQPITAIDGSVSNVWDAMQAHYDPKAKQWTASLKPEFASEENKKNWEQFDSENYFSWKAKIRQVIKNTHGNFDVTSGMMAKSSHVGQAFTFFKTWLPTELYKRFAIPQTDLSLNKEFKGRYRSFTPLTAAIHGAVAGSFFLGPVGLLAGGATFALQNMLGVKSNLSTIQELALVSKLLLKKMVGMPVNLVGSLAGQGKLVNTNLADEVYSSMQKSSGKYNFTKQDFNNFRANMQELAMMLVWFGLLLATKAVLWDDDDKEDDPRRMTHNILANRFMSLGSSAMQYLNVYELGQKTMLTLPVFNFITNVGTVVYDASKILTGDDTLTTGINAGESRTLNKFKSTFLPGIFSQSMLGFEKQSERQFEASPYDTYFRGEEKKAKLEIQSLKAERKQELLDQGLDEDQADKQLNKEFPRKKKQQTYVDLLDQVDGEDEE